MSIDWSKVESPRTQVGDGLAAQLESMILDGTLKHGERLPSERELAERLGSSRTSLRDALRDLQLKGLIERRPGRGTTVVDPKKRNFEGAFLLKMDSERRQMLEIMDLRLVIEPPIAARAARRATARDIQDLRRILATMESGGVDGGADLDAEFHSRIARATQNPILMQLIAESSKWFDQTRRRFLFSERRLEGSIEAHREILKAIEAGDPDAALVAMTAHIERVNVLLEEL